MQIPSFYQEAAARRCDVAVQISADSSHHKKRSEKKKGTLHFYSSCFVEDRREGGSVRSKRVNVWTGTRDELTLLFTRAQQAQNDKYKKILITLIGTS